MAEAISTPMTPPRDSTSKSAPNIKKERKRSSRESRQQIRAELRARRLEEEFKRAQEEAPIRDYAEKYRKAITEKDFETLKTLDKSRLKSFYYSRCDAPGCDCVEEVSIFSRLEYTRVDPSVVTFLLDNNLIETEDVLKLLYNWMTHSCDEDIDRIVVALEWVIRNFPDMVRSYIDNKNVPNVECYNTTLLHASTYGYSNFQERLVLMLVEAGCDPFAKTVDGQTPFQVMLVSSYDKAVSRVKELYPSKIDVNARSFEKNDKYKTGRSNLQSLLYRYRYVKDRSNGMFDSLRRTIKFMLDHGIDLANEDVNGMNVTNYIYMYKYNQTDFFKGVALPIPKNAYIRHDPIYKYMNPSPLAFALYDHRYDKTTGAVMDELRQLFAAHGMPTAEEIQRRFLTKKIPLDDGTEMVVVDNTSDVEYRSLSDLAHSWYPNTDVSKLFSTD